MGIPCDAWSERWQPDGLVRLAAANPCPVLVLDLNATLLNANANAGSWLILQEWNIAAGSRIPEPWRSSALAAATSGETREATLSAGMVSVFLMFVPVPEQGLIYVFGVDVTGQKHIEQKIALNAQVFESALEGILIMDAEMRVIDVNPAYTTITGYSPAEVLGETAAFCRIDVHGSDFVSQLLETLQRQGRWQGEVWGRRALRGVAVDHDREGQ